MNAHPAITDADVGRMVRVDHRYGQQAGVSRGKLLAVDDRRAAASVEPLPRNHRVRAVWVPVEHLHLDVKADAITAAAHGRPAAVVLDAVVVRRPVVTGGGAARSTTRPRSPTGRSGTRRPSPSRPRRPAWPRRSDA